MTNKQLFPDNIYQYLLDNSLHEHPVLKKLRDKTNAHPLSIMMASPDEAQFLAWLIQLTHAKKIIEVGSFTGYTTLAMALALPRDGKIEALDTSTEFTDVGKPFWQEAGVEHKIELHIAEALKTLDQFIRDGKANTFDFIFIDADKVNYEHYFERAVTLVRQGGIIAVDNVLGAGDSLAFNLNDHSSSAKALRAVNKKIFADTRVTMSMIPFAQGLTVALKK